MVVQYLHHLLWCSAGPWLMHGGSYSTQTTLPFHHQAAKKALLNTPLGNQQQTSLFHQFVTGGSLLVQQEQPHASLVMQHVEGSWEFP